MGDIVGESPDSDSNIILADSLCPQTLQQLTEAKTRLKKKEELKLKRRQNFYRKFNTYRKRRKTSGRISKNPLSKPVEELLVEKSIYCCPQCRYWARTEYRFHIHFMEHKKIPLFQCSDCRFTGFHRQHIWSHIHQVSSTDRKHKRSTCRMLSITPTENYDTYLQVAQVPPTAYSGLLPSAIGNSIQISSPVNVDGMTNKVNSAEVVEMPAEPTVQDTSTSEQLNVKDNPVSIESNDFTVVLEPVSGSPQGTKRNNSKRKRRDSIDIETDKIKTENKASNGVSEHFESNPEVLLNRRQQLSEEIAKIEDEIKNRYVVLKSIGSKLEKRSQMLMEQKEKIKTFEKEKGDSSDQLKLACIQKDKEGMRVKIKNCKSKKLLTEMDMRMQQTDNLKIQMMLIELEESDEEYSTLEKKLAQGDEKVVNFTNATKEISDEISELERQEREFDCQIAVMENVMAELEDMEKTAKKLEAKCKDLKQKKEDVICDIGKHIDHKETLKLTYVKILYQESVITTKTKIEEERQNLNAYW